MPERESFNPEEQNAADTSRRALLGSAAAAAAGYALRHFSKRHVSENKPEVPIKIEIAKQPELTPPKFIDDPSPSREEGFVNRPEIFGLMRQARAGLEQVPVGEPAPLGQKTPGKKGPPLPVLDGPNYNVVLAIADSQNPGEVGMVTVDMLGRASREGFKISRGPALGVGTKFEVKDPPHQVVLATKRTLHPDSGPKDVVYTPGCEDLDTPLVRKEGFNYLAANLTAARDELRELGVKSHAFSGNLVSEVMPLKVALKLAMSEHIDPKIFKREVNGLMHPKAPNQTALSQEDAENQVISRMANQTLTVIGANHEMAFAYSRSKAGALGLFQFMFPTYVAIAAEYPEAKLPGWEEAQEYAKVYADFTKSKKRNDIKVMGQSKARLQQLEPGLNQAFIQAMADHKAAAKASLLLFDSDLSDVSRAVMGEAKNKHSKEEKKAFMAGLVSRQNTVGEVLAASYNQGSTVTSGLVAHKGLAWSAHIPSDETRLYLAKYRALSVAFGEDKVT